MALNFQRAWPAIATLALAAQLAACSPPQQAAAPPPEKTESAPVLPGPPPVAGRAEVLEAFNQAAEAAALGRPDPVEAVALNGRRFAIRIPFGCFGPDMPGEATYAYDAAKKTLKVTAKPEQWGKDDQIRALLAAPDAEAIEGFWILRPWIRTGDCPAAPPQPDAAPAQPDHPAGKSPPAAQPALPAPAPTVGLAQVFGKDSSRLSQRGGRAYEVIRKVETAPAGGFRLILEGRALAPDKSSPIHCRIAGPDQRPQCLLAVEFDRVAVEGADGALVSEWRS